MPPLSTYNHFEVLSNIHDSKTTLLDVQKPEETPSPVLNPLPVLTLRIHRPKWQKTLLKALTITAAEEVSTSLRLKVEIETTDTAEKNPSLLF